MQGRAVVPLGGQAVGGQQLGPALQGQGPGTDLDDAGEFLAGGLAFLVGEVREPGHLVHGVAAAGTQQPGGLRDDGMLGLL